MLKELRQVPGLVDLRIQQPFDYPTLEIAVDRTKAIQGGFNEQSVANNILNTLSGSNQITPMFFLNWKNGVNYPLVAQTPQYRIQSLQDLQNIPLIHARPTPRRKSWATSPPSERGTRWPWSNHYNIRRVIDIYGAPQDRDLGGVSRDVQRIVDQNRKDLPRGTYHQRCAGRWRR